MRRYTLGEITLETALFYCSSPTEFSLQVQGIAGSSDRTFEGFQGADKSADKSADKGGDKGADKGGAGAGGGGGDMQGLSRNPMAR
jgi:hypothetical protein